MTWTADWLVASERLHLDALSQRVSVIDVLDNVVVMRVPCALQGFALCARFGRADNWEDEGVIHVRLERDKGDGGWELVKHTEAAFGPMQPTAYAHVSFRVLRVWSGDSIVFRLRWRLGSNRWRKGPEHRIMVMCHPEGEAMSEQLDQLPPLG